MTPTLEEIEKMLSEANKPPQEWTNVYMTPISIESVSRLVNEVKEINGWLEASRKVNKVLGMEVNDLKLENAKLVQRVRELEEALKFYLDNDIYCCDACVNGLNHARKALEGKND